jgi:hypothetical protein
LIIISFFILEKSAPSNIWLIVLTNFCFQTFQKGFTLN